MLLNLPKLPPSKVPDAFQEIRKFYFGEKQFTEDVIDEYIQCTGDSHIVFGVHEVAEMRAKAKSPTYLYRFSHNAPTKLSTTNFFEKDVEGMKPSPDPVVKQLLTRRQLNQLQIENKTDHSIQ